MVTHKKIPFDLLIFLDDNPRTRSPEGLQSMADDIAKDPTFFDNRPVLVNLTGGEHRVYAGDLRAHAAHDVLGWKEIPCNIEPDIPPEVMRRRAIKDNLHRETWAADVLTTSWASDDLEGWGLARDAWGDADEVDYSEKNKELDTNSFFDEMELKFKFSKDDFMDVQERINVVCAKQNVETKEDALKELLIFYERHGS